jgi:hypothetical protein
LPIIRKLRVDTEGLIGMQLPEKYKENFDVSSEGTSSRSSVLKNVLQHQQHYCQEMFNKISWQEIFLHLAGNVCRLIYRNAI